MPVGLLPPVVGSSELPYGFTVLKSQNWKIGRQQAPKKKPCVILETTKTKLMAGEFQGLLKDVVGPKNYNKIVELLNFTFIYQSRNVLLCEVLRTIY